MYATQKSFPHPILYGFGWAGYGKEEEEDPFKY